MKYCYNDSKGSFSPIEESKCIDFKSSQESVVDFTDFSPNLSSISQGALIGSQNKGVYHFENGVDDGSAVLVNLNLDITEINQIKEHYQKELEESKEDLSKANFEIENLKTQLNNSLSQKNTPSDSSQ